MKTEPTKMTRRELLSNAFGTTALVAIGAGYVSAPNAAWALEVTHITADQMATLIQMARDIYPHDNVGDEYYAVAVKAYDAEDKKEMVALGVSELNSAAQSMGAQNYKDMHWEENRVAVLEKLEDSTFFQTLRGGLVTGLYNQKAIWPIFGYEGESFSKGGYIDRGFNDINWL